MMSYLSKATLLALNLATATPSAVAKADFLDDFAAYPNSTFFNGGKTRVIVGYNDELAAERFAITLPLQSINGQVNFNFKEVSNHKFKRPQEVEVAPPDVDSMSITAEEGWGWVQEGAMSTGYSVLEFESSDVNAQMDLLSSVLRDIPGVVSVEKDGVVHAFSLSTQKQKILRDGEGAADLDPTPDTQEAIKNSNGQITESGEEAKHDHGRRLAETIPYGINMVGSAYVNDKTPPAGAQPITICVIDTGYHLGHDDLPGSSHGVDGFSPYGGSELWDVDGNGHGTHCAGTIGAIGDNGIGVTSVNPDPTKFKFYIGKGLKNAGDGIRSDIMETINKCVENGAKVISMSLGGSSYLASYDNLIKDHYDNNGVLVIAAAGNDGSSAPRKYPASFKTVVSVAAIDSNKNRASFSETNDQVELSGPGVLVYSTKRGNSYTYKSGTSMACPHVAGVAALIWYHFPDCTNNQIRNVLILSSKDLGGSSWDSKYGWGLVNAKAAYDLLASQGCEAGGPSDYGRPLSEVALGGKDQLSKLPSSVPSSSPSSSLAPSLVPTSEPSSNPSTSAKPSNNPTSMPSTSLVPTSEPSLNPSTSAKPSNNPTSMPSTSLVPTSEPSLNPSASAKPSNNPTSMPSTSLVPTSEPSLNPSASAKPSNNPTSMPSTSLVPTKAGKKNKRRASKTPKAASLQAQEIKSNGSYCVSISLPLLVVTFVGGMLISLTS